jgi:hypothetical protein
MLQSMSQASFIVAGCQVIDYQNLIKLNSVYDDRSVLVIKHISHTCICWFYYVNGNERLGSVKCSDRQDFFKEEKWSENLVRLSSYLCVSLIQHLKQIADFSRNLAMPLEDTIQCNYLQSAVTIQRTP